MPSQPSYYIDGLLRKVDAAGARTYLGISGGGGGSVQFSAGTLSSLRTDITFSNSNGISFGLNAAGVITASVAPGAGAGTGFTSATTAGTNVVGTLGAGGLSMGIPAYLTTAQPPGAYLTTAQPVGTYAGTGFTTATTAGTNIVGTLSTNGLSMGVPAYLTTAVGGGGAGTNTSVATTAGTDLTLGVNTSGVTIGYPKWITTYVNDLTSARAGTNTSVATTAGTDLSCALNTSGLTIAYPKWITTYVNDLTSARAGTNTSVATTAGTDLSCALNTSGLTIAYPKWITTYVNDLTSGRAGVGEAVSTTAGTDLTLGVDTNGVTIGYPKWLTTAAATNVTSACAGTNTSVATTTGTDLSFAVNTSGITIAYPKWITTATGGGGAGTGFTTATTSGTNIVGTLDTNGLNMGVPAYLTTAAAAAITASMFGNDPAMNALGTGASGLTQTLGSSLFVEPFCLPYYISFDWLRFNISYNDTASGSGGTTQANSTYSVQMRSTIAVVLYSQGVGASSLSIRSVASTSAGITKALIYGAGAQGSRYTVTQQWNYPISNSTSQFTTSYAISAASISVDTGLNGAFTGARFLDVPWATSFAPGGYWFGIGVSQATSTNSANISFASTCSIPMTVNVVTAQNLTMGQFGQPTGGADCLQPFQGNFTTNSALFSTASIASSQMIKVTGVNNPTIPFWMLRRA